MKIIILFACLLISTFAIAQNKEQIDSLVKARYASVAPGCVVLVAKSGQIIYSNSFGRADLKTKVPIPQDGVFRLGSMSKQYTAVAILQLAEQGKIRLTDSIQVYVKDFPHKAWPITIENLLSQSSGIINYQDIKNPDPKKTKDTYTPAQGVDYFEDEPLQFKPGSRFEYSNSNYYLLGYIIELVSGQAYGTYMEQHIFSPAGLQHTYYVWPDKVIPNMVPGYSRFDQHHWENAELQNVTIMYAAGGLAANINDVWQWHEALLKNKLVSKSSLERAWTAFPVTDGAPQYGYGWFIKNINGLKTVEHSGSTDGYQTDEVYIPEKDLFVATLFNGFETDMDWQVLTNDIVRLVLDNGVKKAIKLPDDSLQRLVGTYQYNPEHRMVVSFKGHRLYIEATNPKDRLPKVELLEQGIDAFYIKEAALQFTFVTGHEKDVIKLFTYITPEKKEEWLKVK